MGIHNKDIEKIYQFISKNGFDLSFDEIAIGIGITKKTMYNRYNTKSQLEEEVLKFWNTQILRRFEEKIVFSNNQLEQLLLLIYEFETCAKSETIFFKKEFQYFWEQGTDTTNFFQNILLKILENGIENDEFVKDLNLQNYSKYFLFNVVHFFLTNYSIIPELGNLKKMSPDIYPIKNHDISDFITYLLAPLLTAKGINNLKQIDLLTYFQI